ncbi:hypothetical protein [Leuconostoc sp.]
MTQRQRKTSSQTQQPTKQAPQPLEQPLEVNQPQPQLEVTEQAQLEVPAQVQQQLTQPVHQQPVNEVHDQEFIIRGVLTQNLCKKTKQLTAWGSASRAIALILMKIGALCRVIQITFG